jgi:hypothetical protein
MGVRAKFYCYSVTQSVNGGQVTLQAVCRGEDNKKWAAATPSGKIEMTILNEVATEQFVAGEEYFIDFTPAPKGKEGMGG